VRVAYRFCLRDERRQMRDRFFFHFDAAFFQELAA
jgi:hypothetical protein